jgi:hypothetical protein
MAKQPTPQGISALLRKAGFERSVSLASRIRGFREHSEGYRVTAASDGKAEVDFLASSFRSPDEIRIKAMLARYRAVIEASGYTVAEGGSPFSDSLIVSAATDPEESK